LYFVTRLQLELQEFFGLSECVWMIVDNHSDAFTLFVFQRQNCLAVWCFIEKEAPFLQGVSIACYADALSWLWQRHLCVCLSVHRSQYALLSKWDERRSQNLYCRLHKGLSFQELICSVFFPEIWKGSVCASRASCLVWTAYNVRRTTKLKM